MSERLQGNQKLIYLSKEQSTYQVPYVLNAATVGLIEKMARERGTRTSRQEFIAALLFEALKRNPHELEGTLVSYRSALVSEVLQLNLIDQGARRLGRPRTKKPTS